MIPSGNRPNLPLPEASSTDRVQCIDLGVRKLVVVDEKEVEELYLAHLCLIFHQIRQNLISLFL